MYGSVDIQDNVAKETATSASTETTRTSSPSIDEGQIPLASEAPAVINNNTGATRHHRPPKYPPSKSSEFAGELLSKITVDNSSGSLDFDEYKNDGYPFKSISKIKIEHSNVSDKVLDTEVYRSLLSVDGDNGSPSQSPYRPSSPSQYCGSPGTGICQDIEDQLPDLPFLTVTPKKNDVGENFNQGDDDEPLDALAALIAEHCAKNEVNFVPGGTSILPNSMLRTPSDMQDELSSLTPSFLSSSREGQTALARPYGEHIASADESAAFGLPPRSVLLSIEEGEQLDSEAEFFRPPNPAAEQFYLIEESDYDGDTSLLSSSNGRESIERLTEETEDITADDNDGGTAGTENSLYYSSLSEYCRDFALRMGIFSGIMATSLATACVISLKIHHECVKEEEQESFNNLGFFNQLAVCICSDESRDLFFVYAVASAIGCVLGWVLVFYLFWSGKKLKKTSLASSVKCAIFPSALISSALFPTILVGFLWLLSCIVEKVQLTKRVQIRIDHGYRVRGITLRRDIIGHGWNYWAWLSVCVLAFPVRLGASLFLVVTGSLGPGLFCFFSWALIWGRTIWTVHLLIEQKRSLDRDNGVSTSQAGFNIRLNTSV
mmetsp:Transcript_11604/g.24755  ORF Transcript_11604/g.24755 Transcript_11604/m.24755 type:complete len:605 (+) Transcript_11604:115-1929(+)|eukprot:CAMPEP_0183702866 /NCGR_PEP_ID=MMETSP0737-20130205/824_1 /TAXON_ID=385413 /ORGANISM="Thalassiosira miniscula, Strain CCMP1093" /LENGTH=604 /DNA_ID=CAMNT_0025929547 /DNA_START=50 /DNA_END=1864 /DNA_ORIENTATION=+